MGCEIKGSSVEAVPRRLGWVGPPRAEVGEGELGVNEEVVPPVGWEGEVGR